MTERVFGIETEYAVGAADGLGARVEHDQLVGGLMRIARAKLPHLPDELGNGLFLQNGARFYLDCGGHPEMTTPECWTPWDVVRYVRAGESILLGLASGSRTGRRPAIYRSNVDYSGSGAAWGTHESYMHEATPSTLPAQLIPHLVSRIVYSGAGGFDNRSPGLEFLISPRTAHITADVSNDSTRHRGIFHAKDEPLCGRDRHRLHVIFGESLCSDLAVWLKVGATALVVAMCEAGLRPGDGVRLVAPLDAMRAFAGDPTLTATAVAGDGRQLTAIAIQRHYLALAETHVAGAFMPPWAAEVCRAWRAVLDRLSGGWEHAATSLDWAIKLALYQEHAHRHGFAWTTVTAWNRVVRQLGKALRRGGLCGRTVTIDLVLARDGPIAEEAVRLAPTLDRLGIAWKDFDGFLALREALFEIDTRFGQLGDRGIFATLDRAGVVAHRVDGADDVARAVTEPPARGRARVRGALVRELARNAGRYYCDWQHVRDAEGRRHVDLSDPFVSEAGWTDSGIADPFASERDALRELLERVPRPEAQAREPAVPREPDPIDLNRRALFHRKHHRLSAAERLLRQAIEIEDRRVEPDSPKRPHRRNNLAMVLLRAGRLDESRAVNAAAWALKAGRHDLTSGRILFVRTAIELLSRGDPTLHLGQLKTLLDADSLDCLGAIDPIWEIPDVIRMLRRKLPRAVAHLLATVAETLNDRQHLAALERMPAWRDAAAIPLDAPWPA